MFALNWDACAELGTIYKFGRGVEEDIGKAVALYRLAAPNNSDLDRSYLGGKYEKGRGVENNVEEANRLFLLATNNGCACGCVRIGMNFINGGWFIEIS